VPTVAAEALGAVLVVAFQEALSVVAVAHLVLLDAVVRVVALADNAVPFQVDVAVAEVAFEAAVAVMVALLVKTPTVVADPNLSS
jgi:hypothetical protein